MKNVKRKMKSDISLRRINHQQLNINNQYVASRNHLTMSEAEQ